MRIMMMKTMTNKIMLKRIMMITTGGDAAAEVAQKIAGQAAVYAGVLEV